jgi:8-oxo-dGTP diphosphatase
VSKYRRRPIDVAADVAVLTLVDGELSAVLVTRGKAPFLGAYALPGGFVHDDEDLVDAAVRELSEETDLHLAPDDLVQIGAYGAPERDPREDRRVVSICFVALVADLPPPAAGTDASGVAVVAVDRLLDGTHPLAFDHRQLLTDAVERVRTLIEETPAALRFCPGEFTIPELLAVYEAVWGMPLHRGNFRHRVTHTPGFVEPTGRKRAPASGVGRLAELYRAGPAERLHPAIRRPGTYFRT